jgi:CRP-like cAMP-binding protein
MGEVDMGTLLAPEELKKHLTAAGSKISREQGAYLFRRGDPVSGIFLIVKGKVALRLDRESAVFASREVGPGAVLGLPATLSDSPYSLSAEVTGDAELMHLPRQALLDLLRDHSDLCFEVMSILSEELGESRNALSRIRKIRLR